MDININDKEKISFGLAYTYSKYCKRNRILYNCIMKYRDTIKLVDYTNESAIPNNYSLKNFNQEYRKFLIHCEKCNVYLNAVGTPVIIIASKSLDIQPNIIEVVTNDNIRMNIRDLYYTIIASCDKVESDFGYMYTYSNIFISRLLNSDNIFITLEDEEEVLCHI